MIWKFLREFAGSCVGGLLCHFCRWYRKMGIFLYFFFVMFAQIIPNFYKIKLIVFLLHCRQRTLLFKIKKMIYLFLVRIHYFLRDVKSVLWKSLNSSYYKENYENLRVLSGTKIQSTILLNSLRMKWIRSKNIPCVCCDSSLHSAVILFLKISAKRIARRVVTLQGEL